MKQKDSLEFVIHKHDATSLHFDVRLQVGDIMPSWAVPKGPTLDPTLKRLAMQTPDHTFEYRTYEGMLPEGSYGAGPVLIWDKGVYFPEVEVAKGKRERVHGKKDGSKVMREGLKKGEIKFFLEGVKMKGSFALIKTRGFGGENAWLLIKHRDEYCQNGFDAKDHSLDESVVSGKKLQDLT